MSEQALPLSVDWLGLSIRMLSPIVGCPAGHTWAKYGETGVWYSRWALYNEFGDKVFTILFSPRSRIIRADQALLEVSNEWLYHGIGIRGVLRLLGEVCRFTITGMSRLDLACDFVPNDVQHDIIVGLDRRSHYVSGKQNGSGFWSTGGKSTLNAMWMGYCPHDMNWGHKTSNVKWKLYYKSKELRDDAGGVGWSKPYIVDMWRECGMDETNVWRLEVSLKNCNTFDFLGEPLTFERFMHNTTALYKSLYTSRFDIRLNQGHKDRTNDARVPFLPVGYLHDGFHVHREEHLVEHNSANTLLRHLYADSMTEEVLLNEKVREAILSAMETIIEAGGMERYFYAMAGEEFESWREWLRVKAYYFDETKKGNPADNEVVMEQAIVSAGDENLFPLGAQSSSVSHSGTRPGAKQQRLPLP